MIFNLIRKKIELTQLKKRIIIYTKISKLDLITKNYPNIFSLMGKNSRKYWRHGQVVRQWIANPRSPVRIWVSPKKKISFFYNLIFSIVFYKQLFYLSILFEHLIKDL